MKYFWNTPWNPRASLYIVFNNYENYQTILVTKDCYGLIVYFTYLTYFTCLHITDENTTQCYICAYQNTLPSSITNLGHDNQHWYQHIEKNAHIRILCGKLLMWGGRVSYHIKNVSSAKLGVRKYKIHRKLILHIQNTNRNVLSCLTLNWELGCSTSITFGSIRYIELLRLVHL